MGGGKDPAERREEKGEKTEKSSFLTTPLKDGARANRGIR